MASKLRPQSIKRAQKKAWGEVKRARSLFLKAGKRFDRTMGVAQRLMKESSLWETEHRHLTEKLLAVAERARDRASTSEMEAIRKIRRQLDTQFQDRVQRVPVLRHVLSRSRSRPPTPLGKSASESASSPKH